MTPEKHPAATASQRVFLETMGFSDSFTGKVSS
jgi:hypothetical protein